MKVNKIVGLFLVLFLGISCNGLNKSEKDIITFQKTDQSEDFENKALKIIPAERFSKGFSSAPGGLFSDRDAVTFTFTNPKDGIENVNVNDEKVDKVKTLVQSQFPNLNQFSGFEITLFHSTIGMDSVRVEKSYTYKYNTGN